ncbi:MAG: DUF1592 domain-containing protein, partial [Verrucomicrobiota bacterium]
LTSMRFLYVLEPVDEGQIERRELDALSLACRLSYFLWSSPPDAELYQLAESGELLNPSVLEVQVERMLVDPRAENFFDGFMGQWIHIKRFKDLNLTARILLHWTEGFIDSARREPIEFFEEMVAGNLGIANLIDSEFVMVDGVLANAYGLEGYAGDGFQKVVLPEASPRGGVITQSAFLAAGTMGNRTSPVIRGALVREILLNDPPPPPPPNVPELVAEGEDPLKSVRTLVEMHQQKAQCASCHARFDQIGLGLENFDPIGMWREEEMVTLVDDVKLLRDGSKKDTERNWTTFDIDSSGNLPSGEEFQDVKGLKAALMKEERAVAESMFEGLMIYALGRDISFTDLQIIEDSLEHLGKVSEGEGERYRVRDMIKRVVTSGPFREF